MSLEPFDEARQPLHTISAGAFLCRACTCWYPIVGGVPVLLDFSTPVHERFEAKHRASLQALGAGTAPRGRPRPGERLTQSSFSTEWRTVRDDELTFTYTHSEREDFIRIELDGLLESPPEGPVLDVGCGYGTEAVLLQRVTDREVIGTDLNLSLLDSGAEIDRLPLVHTVIASLFALPFAPTSFDLVYSHGVLHHTHSTAAAFDAVARFVRDDGSLVVWVYATEDFAHSAALRFSAAAERAFRPAIASAPTLVQSAVVQALSVPHFIRYKRGGPNRDRWRFRNSVHSIRDRWTPRYAHRHEAAEVLGWFRSAGFDPQPVDADAYERRFGIPLIGIGMRGTRT